MSDFERTKQVVGGRSILITSWYDDSRQNWHASAPAYSYLSSLRPEAPIACTSRQEAIQRLTGLLATHFTNMK